ncbi:hypothetical protein HDU92_003406 [Lobulomyces angularis]|nr:hypothetical protein HDU92_003406 [Lobulomyces angularis]
MQSLLLTEDTLKCKKQNFQKISLSNKFLSETKQEKIKLVKLVKHKPISEFKIGKQSLHYKTIFSSNIYDEETKFKNKLTPAVDFKKKEVPWCKKVEATLGRKLESSVKIESLKKSKSFFLTDLNNCKTKLMEDSKNFDLKKKNNLFMNEFQVAENESFKEEKANLHFEKERNFLKKNATSAVSGNNTNCSSNHVFSFQYLIKEPPVFNVVNNQVGN